MPLLVLPAGQAADRYDRRRLLAAAFDGWLRDRVEAGDLDALVRWRHEAPHAELAHPTAEHLRPLFMCLGAGAGGEVSWPLTGFEHGSTSRRSLQLD
jgi:4,5-DOPA dioxygenase extradiol